MICLLFLLQFDALIERLTGREYLTCVARIHGHTPSSIPKVVQKIIKRLGLNEFADRTCGTYRFNLVYSFIYLFHLFLSNTNSGGNMRKLSVAIALVGDPSIVFLVTLSLCAISTFLWKFQRMSQRLPRLVAFYGTTLSMS